MRWKKENTQAVQDARRHFQTIEWQTAFAWVPTEMSDNTVVWLERYQWKRVPLPDYAPAPGPESLAPLYYRRHTGSTWEPDPMTGPYPRSRLSYGQK